MKHVPGGVVLHQAHHFLEEVKALTLILDEWVALAHGPQADPRSQIIHLGQVLTPPIVDDEERMCPLGSAHHLSPVLLLTRRIHGVGVVLIRLDEFLKDRRANSMPLWTRPATYQKFYSKLGFYVERNYDVYAKKLDQDILSTDWIARYQDPR